MKYYNTALKPIFTDLISFDISLNLTHDYQLKQDALENIWAAISILDSNTAHTHEIEGIIDLLNDAIVFLETMKTNNEKEVFIDTLKTSIENIEREIR